MRTMFRGFFWWLQQSSSYAVSESERRMRLGLIVGIQSGVKALPPFSLYLVGPNVSASVKDPPHLHR